LKAALDSSLGLQRDTIPRTSVRGYNFSSKAMPELVFTVTLDEDGNYCAHAQTARGDLLTDARSLDQLYRMIVDLIGLYEDDTQTQVAGFTLRFGTPRGVAA
jgi:hypothetical protein